MTVLRSNKNECVVSVGTGVSDAIPVTRGDAHQHIIKVVKSASRDEPQTSESTSVIIEDDTCEDLEMCVSFVSESCISDNEAEQQKPLKQNNNRYCNTEFSVERWADSPCELVNEIPSYINGLCKYVIECDVKDFMKVTKDGRPWTTWHSSSRKGFDGIRRTARCKGSLMCKSDSCLFRKQNGCCDKYHFETRDGITRCFTCGSVPESVDCLAVKVWEYDRAAKTATVYHDGTHSCAVKKILKQASKRSIMHLFAATLESNQAD